VASCGETSDFVKESRGLVVGKFWPPHRGHVRLIEELLANCDRVFVVVCSNHAQRPTGLDRASWIQVLFPTAEVIIDDDRCAWHYPGSCAPECTDVWASRIEELGIRPIHVVAAGESYGKAFAKALGARHLDIDRNADGGVSASQIRADLARFCSDLPLVVRAGLYRKVTILGAESTGTSTLASDLARELQGPLASEAGRTYSWKLFAAEGSMDAVKWTEYHFWQIVDRQSRLERDSVWMHAMEKSVSTEPWLVCDTDTLATVAWWERYLKSDASAVEKLALARSADLYIHTSPAGIDFDDSDPTRDGRQIRLAMASRFRDLLEQSGSPWIEVVGDRESRLNQAVQAIRDFDKSHPRWVHH